MQPLIRNLAIIAHVDHGKTTLVDLLLRAGGELNARDDAEERVMDSMDLEREKGITIRAKNTAVHWKGCTINIVDTPGHADFGGEVERVMKMVDGVLLVVDAVEGPQAQTRFVLRKAFEQGLLPVVVINKVDRPQADSRRVHNEVLELFLELDATDAQFHAAFLYGSARDGWFSRSPDEPSSGIDPLLEAILEQVPPPKIDAAAPFRMLVSNIDWDDYVGRIAIGKIESGSLRRGEVLHRLRPGGARDSARITRVIEFASLRTRDCEAPSAGNIVGIAGFEDVEIGETLAANPDAQPLPFVSIDPPTVQMDFSVNDSPFAGREGKYVTSRQIRDRLARETKTNVSIQVADAEQTGAFRISARGAMQIAVLVEQMRREGYELLVSSPSVITRVIDGRSLEPFETLYVEVPEAHLNSVLKSLGARRARIESMHSRTGHCRIEAVIPTRGLIGFQFDLLNQTAGTGVCSHLFREYAPHCGPIATRQTGALVSTETGTAMAYSLGALEERGRLFVRPGDPVYEGQMVGENPRGDDLPVNPTKAKHVTNHRSQGDGKAIQLSPPLEFSLERAIEYIASDELIEVTPAGLRLRKRVLCPHERRRQRKRDVVSA